MLRLLLLLIGINNGWNYTSICGQTKETKHIAETFIVQMDSSIRLCRRYCNEDYLRYLEQEYYQQIIPPTTIEEDWKEELLIEGVLISYSEAQRQLQRKLNKTISVAFTKPSSKTQKGMYILSKPIFSLDKQTAIVWVTFSCSPLCASASLYCYKKIQDSWVLYKKRILRLS